MKNAIEFENSISELVHSIAKNADATLAMDAAKHGFDTPISINSIIEHIFVNNEQPSLTMDNTFHVAKDNLMREITQAEKEEIVPVKKLKEVAINEEDEIILSNIHDDLLSAFGNYTNDSINEIQRVAVWMAGRVDTSTVLTFFNKMRTIYETVFMGYGSGNSPVERIVYTLESSVKQFNKNLLIMNTDTGNDTIQGLTNDQVETVLASLRTEIRPLVEHYMLSQNAQGEEEIGGLDNSNPLNALVESTVQTIMTLPETVIDSVIHIFIGILHKNDPEGKMSQEDHLRLHLANTLDQVADSNFGLIKERIRVSNFMMHVLTRAADTYNTLETHLTTLVKEDMNDIDNGLYALLNEPIQRQKFANALIRNIKPLTTNVATSVRTFVTDHLDTLHDTSLMRAFSFNPLNIVFNMLNNWVIDIKNENGFLGMTLEILLGFVESMFDDGYNGIPTLLSSLENIMSGIESIISTVMGISKLKRFFF